MGEAPFARLDAELRELLVGVTVLLQVRPQEAHRGAVRLAAEQRARDDDVLSDAIRGWTGQLLASVVESGWTPGDLLEIVRRRGESRMLPVLAQLCATEAERHPGQPITTSWRDEVDRLPPPYAPNLHSVRDLETLLGLAALLLWLPSVERTTPRAAPGRRSAGTSSSKHLSRVRALLAKAESTESPEEAEALSAKAQELISAHALERLLDEPDDVPDGVGVRRIWIDAPYVRPKATLVSEIAGANRCRAVLTERIGFVTVVGESADLDAVELMTASMLVQAQTAMLAHGSHRDGWGTSTTRSFRRSFLIAYAGRIGERLRNATADAAQESGDAKALVPVLKRRAEQVDAALAELFPRLGKGRRTSISNAEGLVAGRAAADLASLNAHKNVTAARPP